MRRGSKRAKQCTLIAGHNPSSAGLPASTAAHILAKKAFDYENPAGSAPYKFVDALAHLQTEPEFDRLLIIKLDIQLASLISGGFPLSDLQDASVVVDSFPAKVIAIKDIPTRNSGGQRLRYRVSGLDGASRALTFVISCNAVRFWFDTCLFTQKPMSTYLNQKKYTKVQLGGAVASIFPCLERMTLLALRDYSSTGLLELWQVNEQICSPECGKDQRLVPPEHPVEEVRIRDWVPVDEDLRARKEKAEKRFLEQRESERRKAEARQRENALLETKSELAKQQRELAKCREGLKKWEDNLESIVEKLDGFTGAGRVRNRSEHFFQDDEVDNVVRGYESDERGRYRECQFPPDDKYGDEEEQNFHLYDTSFDAEELRKEANQQDPSDSYFGMGSSVNF